MFAVDAKNAQAADPAAPKYDAQTETKMKGDRRGRDDTGKRARKGDCPPGDEEWHGNRGHISMPEVVPG